MRQNSTVRQEFMLQAAFTGLETRIRLHISRLKLVTTLIFTAILKRVDRCKLLALTPSTNSPKLQND